MRYLKFFPLLLSLISLSLPAVEGYGLYEAEVAVADQGAAARAEALTQAMSAVLLKVSGYSGVLAEEALQAALQNAARYVQQYRYRSEPIPEQERKAAMAGQSPAAERLLLWTRFDGDSIERLLRQYGFSVWGTARPTLLVWLAVEERGKRVLVGANDRGLVRETLEAEAARRALPLRLPLLDLSDQGKVRPVDIWGGFFEPISEASQRYEAQAILVGKLYPLTAQQWEVRWTLLHRGAQQQWQQQSKDVAALVAAGVGTSTDYLSQSFAERMVGGSNAVLLRVDGVRDMGDYRRLYDYLSALHGVSAVTLRQAGADSLQLRLVVEGGRELITQSIAMGDILVREEAVAPPAPLVLPPRLQDGTTAPAAAAPAPPPPPERVYRLLP